MRISSFLGATGLLTWSVVGLASCDTDVWTEHRQVDLSSPDLRPGGTFVSGNMLLERSNVCLDFGGHRVSDDDPPQFERVEDDEELRACYEASVRGPAAFDDDGCLVANEPGIVDWELHRRACGVEGDFGDDRIRFDVVPFAAVRAVFGHAVPYPTEILGHEIVMEAPPELPAGFIAAEDEPMRLIEDLATSVETAVLLGDAPHTVWVTEPVVTGSALAGMPRFEEPERPTLSLGFEGSAGDVFEVRLELPAGELEVGEVHLVSRADVASLEPFPHVLRVAETDAFLAIGAVAVARDEQGRVLREPPVRWSVVEGDHEIETVGDDGMSDPSPHAELEEACRGARAGEHRSATLEARLDDFTERVTVQWQCIEDHREGCGCTHRSGNGTTPWLLALPVLGVLRRRRPIRTACAGERGAAATTRLRK